MQVSEGTSTTTKAASQAKQEKGKEDREGCSLLRPTIYDTTTRSHKGVAAEFAQESVKRAESAEKELHISRDYHGNSIVSSHQLRQLRDAVPPPVELDLHA